MDFKTYTRKSAAGAITSIERTGTDVAIVYAEYDPDTGEKSDRKATLDLNQLREERTQMNAQIQQDLDALNALRAERDNLAAMIADITEVDSK